MTQQEALEASDTAAGSGVVGDESPRGETEVMVERLFAEMLDVPGLPRTASVFDLGLDSVWVTVACARLEQMTGVRVRFTQVFRTPTVAQLAAWIDTNRAPARIEPDVPATPSAAEGDELVAITPIQAETVPQKIVVEIAWWFDGEIDVAALERAATDVHRRHQALHARYLHGPELGLAEVPADPGQAEFHRLADEDSDKAAADALRRTLRIPLRVDEGKVWRCVLVRSGESGRTLFGVAVDHSGFDGRSWDILTAELPVAYAARVAGKAPQWPGRTASLAEMACDFRHQLASSDIEAQRQYWRDELHELPTCQFPGRSDGAAQATPMHDGSRYSPAGPAVLRSFQVPESQLRSWNDYARANGMPPSVGVAAVYVESIVRAGALPDFAVMVPIANNSGEVIDRTVTNRVGTILLRPNGPNRSGQHLLARMRGSYQQAMSARDALLAPKDLADALSGSEGVIPLDRMVALNYNSTPSLSLGGMDGVLVSEGTAFATKSFFVVMLLVTPTPEGLHVAVQVRTDLHDSSLVDDIKQHFLDIINDGPERLELLTA
ncbi:condensation domain-containing protein [Micromonospora sp. NPDC093244]|uniref:condensation domain-containing protein n=1 Tax=Micromonospora sp. NPDC093244 TaxID=3155071 RepID=UPI00341450F1